MKIKKHGFLAVALVLVLAVSLIAGCSQKPAETPKPAAEPAKAANPADSFPEKPVTLTLPFGAGGSHDAHARIIEKFAKKYLGQPLVIELKPGGSGAVGSTLVKEAIPDGYTLLFGSNGANTAVPIVENVPYTKDDFVPVAQINYSPTIIITHKNSGIKTIDDLLKKAKANPGKISYASSGMFNSGHMGLEIFQDNSGVTLNHVPMEGAEPQLAVLAGQVETGGAFADEIIDLAADGQIIPLLVTSKERLKEYPDVPCFGDLGYDDEWNMWRTVLAPKDTPHEIVEKLDKAFQGITSDPEFIEMVEKMGEPVHYMGHDDFAKFWDKEWNYFENLFKNAGK